MNRYDARDNAFKLIFSVYFQKNTALDEILRTYKETVGIEEDKYFDALVQTTYEHLAEIDALIEKHLNNWSLRRISKVSLAALRLGITEIKFIDDTPNHVAINEAIELAKKYEDHKCGQFVNGVLSSVMNEQ